MKFIEIKEGVSVAKDEIIALVKIDEYTTRLYTKVGEFEANFPYMTLLQILENEREDINEKVSSMANVVNTLGHFAG